MNYLFLQYIYMSLLCILGFIPMLYYLLNRIKTGPSNHEGHFLAIFLVLIVISLYTIDQLPPSAGFFDPIKVKFVSGLRESIAMRIIKIFYKFSFGIMLMIYGVLGMQKHH